MLYRRIPGFGYAPIAQAWGQRFVDELNEKEGVGLLIDPGPHKFEPIACLKWLKEFLTQAPEVVEIIRTRSPETT